MKTRILVLLGLLAVTLHAQPHGSVHRDSRREEPRIILYEHAHFRGGSLVIYPGDTIPNLATGRFDGGARINDRISSIRIEGPVELYVYEHASFGGHVMRVTESIPNLADRPTPETRISWNDRISSLQAERAPRTRGRAVNPDTLVRRAYEDLFGRAPDTAGLRTYRSLVIDQGWTDQMIRAHLRRSEEYRGPGVERIIRRAYEDILGREPDESGLRSYRRMILEENWTEQQVRDALRRSSEYRNRQSRR